MIRLIIAGILTALILFCLEELVPVGLWVYLLGLCIGVSGWTALLIDASYKRN